MRFPVSTKLVRAFLVCAIALAGLPPSAAQGDRTLDLSGYELAFDEPFETLDVSPWGPGTRWIAHTPWNGDFGDAAFANPQPGFPFTTENGALRIEARRGPDGKWRSGLIASVDNKFTGFAQQYGYFEMRAKLPPGAGLWPAFWLIGVDRSTHTAEIDVLEHYGHEPARYSLAVHAWNRTGTGKNNSVSEHVPVPRGTLYDRFNTFGADVGPEFIRFYFNREEVWRTPTPPQHHQPMFVLVDLALGAGWPIENAPSPSFMYVDYVRVWKQRAPPRPGPASARPENKR